MNDTIINDNRIASDFRNITFSKFPRAKVKKELLNCINNGNVESSCHWSVELICAGHFNDLWEIILLYMGRYIHMGNPKLPIYIDIRFQNFKTIVMAHYGDSELDLRNNDKIRTLFAELVCILCYSRKRHAFESFAIKDINDFDMTHLTRRLKAPNVNFARTTFKEDDPKELFIAINELAYNISNQSRDNTSACYWTEWILQFDILCKNKKISCCCERRVFANVDDKFQMETVWMLWDALLNEAKTRSNKGYLKIVRALLNLYCIKFTPGVKRRRKYLIYSAISCLTEDVNFAIPLVEKKELIYNISSKIGILYKEVKKNEITPTINYLFMGIEKSNAEKSMAKLELLHMV